MEKKEKKKEKKEKEKQRDVCTYTPARGFFAVYVTRARSADR